jgi:hypothetical protein
MGINEPPPHRALQREDVLRIAGRLEDASLAAILATGATAQELVEAMTWVERKDEAGAMLRHPLEGRVASLYRILDANKPDWDTADRA